MPSPRSQCSRSDALGRLSTFTRRKPTDGIGPALALDAVPSFANLRNLISDGAAHPESDNRTSAPIEWSGGIWVVKGSASLTEWLPPVLSEGQKGSSDCARTNEREIGSGGQAKKRKQLTEKLLLVQTQMFVCHFSRCHTSFWSLIGSLLERWNDTVPCV